LDHLSDLDLRRLDLSRCYLFLACGGLESDQAKAESQDKSPEIFGQ
jgi:hypothetical protein